MHENAESASKSEKKRARVDYVQTAPLQVIGWLFKTLFLREITIAYKICPEYSSTDHYFITQVSGSACLVSNGTPASAKRSRFIILEEC